MYIPIIPLDLSVFRAKYATATKTICVLNIIIYLLARTSIAAETTPGVVYEGFSFLKHFALITGEGFSYRIFTHQFLHGGFGHMFWNMIFFLPFGAVLEDKVGVKKMIFFYLVGGAVAGWVTLASSEGFTRLIGASGAVSAIVGACLVLRPKLNVGGIILFFFFQTKTWIWALYFFIQDALFFTATMNDVTNKVAYVAHLGGFGCNFLLCLLALKLGFIRSASSDLLGAFGMRVKNKEESDEDKLKTEVGFRDLSTVDHVIEKLDSEEESVFELDRLLILVKKAKLHGDARDAYRILQAWLEKNNNHERGAEVAYEIASIALRQLNKPQLARDWLADALRREPRDDLKMNIETLQRVMDE